jgi:Abnormal spindle-like microcephaly-assoc'd, ASPM-SPD-2-Hydin/NHL repeat
MNDEFQPVLKRRTAIPVEEIAMRYFKLMVCTGILLLLSGAASAQQDYQDYIVGFAGGGPNNLPATSMSLYFNPPSVALDSAGNFYFTTGSNSDPWENRVWKVTKSTGILTVVAGTYYYGYSGDGGPAVNAQLNTPYGVAVDYLGNVFIADAGNNIVREVNASTGTITTIAGTPQTWGFSGDGGPATSAVLYAAMSVALDKNGNLFIADTYNQRIRMVACATVTSSGGTCTPNAGQTTGNIYTVVGTGNYPYNGDGISATTSNLFNPAGVTTDAAGNLYIADDTDNLIRRVACGTGISGCTPPSGETSGYIYTLAGTGESPGYRGTAGYNGDGILATNAELNGPTGLTVDNEGNLFIADYSNNRIREVSCVTKTSSGGACSPNAGQVPNNIYTVAGTATAGYNGDNQAAITAELYAPSGIAVDSAGNLFIADIGNNIIREVPCGTSQLACTPPAGETARYIYTVAGSYGAMPFLNNVPATAEMLFYPSGAASDSAGNIYIAENQGCAVYEVSASTGNISNFAGTLGTCKYGGDGGPATSAYLAWPSKIAVDSLDNVYIADEYNCVIRKVSGGTISTFAGDHTLGCGYSGDSGAATSAQLYYPTGVAVDSSGNVYIADQSNQVVRKVSGGTISTFAGKYALGLGYSGDNGPATSAQLYNPADVAVDSAGNVYIADESNNRIRKVNPSGIITTYAGNGATGYQGDGVPADETSLYYPQGVAVDLFGDVLIADYANNRVRFVDQGGVIHTVAGGGSTFGNYIPATAAELYQPAGVGVDPSGNIYVADYGYWLVRKINALAMLNSSTASVTFEEQPIKTTSLPVSVTLTSNGPVEIASITASAGFNEIDDCPSTLTNSTCMVDVTFSPTVAGVINGTLTISYNGFFSQETVVNLQGTGTGVTLSPLSLAFGSQYVTTSLTKTVTVKGGTTYAAISATLSGDTTDYKIASNTCIGKITTNCLIGVTFNPLSTGVKKATLVIHDSDPTNPQLAGLTGTGTSYESFSVTSHTFATQVLNKTSGNFKVTFKYTGPSTLTLTGLVASTPYSVNYTGITSGGCNTVTSLSSVAPTCTFNVAFTPTSLGTITGTVTANFTGDPKNSTLVLPLTGVGTEVLFTPASLNFGSIPHGGSKGLSLKITNTSSTNTLHVTAATVTGPYAAAYTPYLTAYCSNLAPGYFCTLNVFFSPTTVGTGQKAVLNLTDDGGGSPQLVNLTGNGT